MNRILAVTAPTALVLAGIGAHTSPVFKQHATTAALVLLTLTALSGLVVGLVLRHLDVRPDMRGSESPPGGIAVPAGIAHTGAVR